MKPVKALAILALGALLGALFIFVLTQARQPSSTAGGVLSVPPFPPQGITGNLDSSRDLAGAYAALLRRDRQLTRIVGRSDGAARSISEFAIDVTRGSPLIELSVTADSRASAVRAMRAVIDAVRARRTQVLRQLEPRTYTFLNGASSGAGIPGNQFRSRATVLVTAPGETRVDPSGANRLAANLTGLITRDARIIAFAANAAGVSPSEFTSGLRVTNSQNTSLVNITYSGTSSAQAVRAVAALAEATTGPTTASPQIPPGTLELVGGPSATGSSSSRTSILAGALLGLVAAAGFIGLRRRREPDALNATVLEEAMRLPAAELPAERAMQAAAFRQLLARTAAAGPVEVVPAGPQTPATTRMLGQLLEDPSVVEVTRAGANGHGGAPVAGVVLVSPRHTSLTALRTAGDRVRADGRDVLAYAVLPDVKS